MNRLLTTILAILLTCSAVGAQTRPPASEQVPSVQIEDRISSAFDRGEYSDAAVLIEKYLERYPNHANMLYNAGCAYCRLDDHDRACSYLLQSVKAGFVDFGHMKRDPDLDAVREHPVYTAILEAASRVDRGTRRSSLQRWKNTYGEKNYRFEEDDVRHLAYATALDPIAHDEMRTMVELEADHLAATLFDGPPDYSVLIAVPTPEDAMRVFDNDDSIGGIYQHGRRRLISRDIGSSLRHEFFHLMHYGHMERIGQMHPIWVQEGMASLYETYELSDGGSIRFLPNERHNIVRRRARSGRTTKWHDLFEMSDRQFMRKAGHLYPQVRSIFEYVADTGNLQTWYETFVKTYDEDPSGARSLELVFGKEIKDIEKDWRKWVIDRPAVDLNIGYGDAALGIETEPRSSNDGVLVTRVLPGTTASRGGIHRGDVIVAVDGRSTRTLTELRAIIAIREVGQRVNVRLRRNGQYLEHALTLRPLVPESQRRRQ